MNKARSLSIVLAYYFTFFHFSFGASNVGGVSGSLETTIQAGTVSTPKYAVMLVLEFLEKQFIQDKFKVPLRTQYHLKHLLILANLI